MINQNSLKQVEQARFSKDFIRPLYDSYCFSNIPQTIRNILLHENKKALPDDVFADLPRTYDKVILFLIDGFGWNFIQKHKNSSPFLQRIINEGVMSKITAQFPPTTANQITTIHTGLTVGEHGHYEWLHYEPELDNIIAPLLFSFAGQKIRDTLTPTGIDPKKLYPKSTFYTDLEKEGIKTTIFQDAEFAFSSYNNSVTHGATVIPYTTLPEAMTQLVKKIKNDKTKSYYFFYFGSIDAMAHKFGPDSPQCQAEIKMFLNNMEVFYKNLYGKTEKTLFLMTADHGHMKIYPKKTVYLNLQFPEIKKWISTNMKGELLVPAGSCRDMFLHIKEKHLNEAQKYLQAKFGNKAEVYKVKDLIDQGFFRLKKPKKTFLDRVGNLVILCRKNNSVWWYEKDRFEQSYKSHHGSMTKQEMEIPFACLTFD